MSDNLIRCVHENGKVCFLTKAATENRNFMKKYGIRVEHVEKKDPAKQPIQKVVVDATEVKQVIDGALQKLNEQGYTIQPAAFEEVIVKNPESEAEAIDKQVADALAEATKPAKPKATRTRAAKSKKPTKK